MKRIFCLLVCLSLIFSLCGCRKMPDETSSASVGGTPMFSADGKSVNLLYSYGDSFNPYTAKTAFNRELSSLLYDSLIKTDNNFDIVYILASSAEIKDKTCTVKLKDATFTDGSAVTANDVIYSYKLAKESPRFLYN